MEHITNVSKMSRKSIVLMVFSLVAFFATAVFGAVKMADSSFSDYQAILIVFQGIVGLALSWFPVVVHKLFKLRISFTIQLVVTVFMIFAMILGEAFNFYYRISWWDSMLHAFSGFGIAFVAYCLVNTVVKGSNLKSKFAICLIGSIVISLAVGLVWEIAEFSMDSIFGTNMQKFIPDAFFNGGQTNTALSGEQEQIAEFFASPDGYRFALMDTMKDIILCLGGTAAFAVLAAATKESSVYSTAIVLDKTIKKHRALKPAKLKTPVFADVLTIDEQITTDSFSFQQAV